MMNISSPWSDRFDGLLETQSIRSRAECLPNAIDNFDSMILPVAEQALKQELQKIIFLSDREVNLLQQLLGCSYAYAATAYPSVQTYLRNIHSEELPLPDVYPVCLTGVAGVGKSTFLTAFQRAMPGPTQLNVGSVVYGEHIPYQSHVRIKVDARSNLSELLRQWLPGEIGRSGLQNTEVADSTRVRWTTRDIVPRAVRYGYRMGYCASLVDEMQFMSQHSSANARLTQVLLTLSYLKSPLIYAANFSMCHKLTKRNQEDKDRLLARPVVLMPLELSDGELGKLLRLYDIVLGSCVKGSLSDFLNEYGSMTLGIRRKVRDLTVAAYVVMREQKSAHLSAEHLRYAYEKRISSAYRDDIESLMTQYSTGKPVATRKDLWCPFGHEYNVTEHLSALASKAIEEKIGNGLMHDLLTPDEKRVVNSLKGTPKTSPRSDEKISHAPSKTPSRKKMTAVSLLTNTLNHQKRDA